MESEQPPILQGRFWEFHAQVPLHHKGERREADQQQQRIDAKKQNSPREGAGAQVRDFPSYWVLRGRRETCVGCIVSWTTATRCSLNWFRSSSLRRVALKAARVRAASYNEVLCMPVISELATRLLFRASTRIETR